MQQLAFLSVREFLLFVTTCLRTSDSFANPQVYLQNLISSYHYIEQGLL